MKRGGGGNYTHTPYHRTNRRSVRPGGAGAGAEKRNKNVVLFSSSFRAARGGVAAMLG